MLVKHVLLHLMLPCSLVVLPGTHSQINLERSKSRMGTFVEAGTIAEANPDEGSVSFDNYT